MRRTRSGKECWLSEKRLVCQNVCSSRPPRHTASPPPLINASSLSRHWFIPCTLYMYIWHYKLGASRRQPQRTEYIWSTWDENISGLHGMRIYLVYMGWAVLAGSSHTFRRWSNFNTSKGVCLQMTKITLNSGYWWNIINKWTINVPTEETTLPTISWNWFPYHLLIALETAYF